MDKEKEPRYFGRKLFYFLLILLGLLVILISLGGIVGSWYARAPVESTAGRMLGVVSNNAAGVRNVVARLDQDLRGMEASIQPVRETTVQLSQTVPNKGMVMTLLPETTDQSLAGELSSLVDTMTTVRNIVASGIGLYASIESLPLVSLPPPSLKSVGELEAAVGAVRDSSEALVRGIREYRQGGSIRATDLTERIDRYSTSLGEVQSWLSELDAEMAALQRISDPLRAALPRYTLLTALLLSLFLAFILYSQVEVIRALAGRWRKLGAPVGAAPRKEEPPAIMPLPEVEKPVSPVLPVEPIQAGESPLVEPETPVVPVEPKIIIPELEAAVEPPQPETLALAAEEPESTSEAQEDAEPDSGEDEVGSNK